MMRLITEFYHRLRYIAVRVLGAKFTELQWKYRHIYVPRWGHISVEGLSHPHRQMLIRKISAYAPFSDVLEVGCASGSNLYLLAKKFPKARFVGADINPQAIKLGQQFFKQKGISNVSLFVGKADALKRFPDKSFDIVFTDAVLMYVSPSDIKRVAAEFHRIARKAVILVEHHSSAESDVGSYEGKWWMRNYEKLFQPFSHQIETTKIPPEVWGGNWGKFGYIVEAKIAEK